ncbi:MAG: hypothetical protein MPJ25_10675, partial [Pirellulales bacterium]|nr:hypothetical protein [Pirellulales bacterium]
MAGTVTPVLILAAFTVAVLARFTESRADQRRVEVGPSILSYITAIGGDGFTPDHQEPTPT